MSELVTSEASMALVTRAMNKPMYTSDLEPFFYKSGHSLRRLFGEEPYLERKKAANPLASGKGSRDVYTKRVSQKPNLIRAPYRKRDGDLHPLVFAGWDMLVNENTLPVGPGYQFQALIKDKRYDEHNFIIMPVAVRRVFSKDLTLSAYGSSFSANSSYNRLFIVADSHSLCELQLTAVTWTLDYINDICFDLRGAGCHCLLVALMPEMNWILQSMIKYSNLSSSSKFDKQDEAQKMKKFIYLEQIQTLITLVKQVQARTGLTIKFWPTSGEDLNGLTVRAEKALDKVPASQKLLLQQHHPEDHALKFPTTPAPVRRQQPPSAIRTGTPATPEDSKENYIWQTLESTPYVTLAVLFLHTHTHKMMKNYSLQPSSLRLPPKWGNDKNAIIYS